MEPWALFVDDDLLLWGVEPHLVSSQVVIWQELWLHFYWILNLSYASCRGHYAYVAIALITWILQNTIIKKKKKKSLVVVIGWIIYKARKNKVVETE